MRQLAISELASISKCLNSNIFETALDKPDGRGNNCINIEKLDEGTLPNGIILKNFIGAINDRIQKLIYQGFFPEIGMYSCNSDNLKLRALFIGNLDEEIAKKWLLAYSHFSQKFIRLLLVIKEGAREGNICNDKIPLFTNLKNLDKKTYQQTFLGLFISLFLKQAGEKWVDLMTLIEKISDINEDDFLAQATTLFNKAAKEMKSTLNENWLANLKEKFKKKTSPSSQTAKFGTPEPLSFIASTVGSQNKSSSGSSSQSSPDLVEKLIIKAENPKTSVSKQEVLENENKVFELNRQLEFKELELSKAKNEQSAISTELEKKENKILELEKELEEIQISNTTKQFELEQRSKEDLSEAQELLKKTAEKLATKEKDLADLQKDLDLQEPFYKQQKNECELKAKESERKATESEDKARASENKAIESERRAQASENNANKSQVKVSELELRIKGLENSIKEISDSHFKLTNESKGLPGIIKNLEANMGSLKATLETERLAHDNTKKNGQLFEAQRIALLEAKNDKIAELLQFNATEEEKRCYEETLQALNKEIAPLFDYPLFRDMALNLRQLIAKLKDETPASQKGVLALRDEINKLKNDIAQHENGEEKSRLINELQTLRQNTLMGTVEDSKKQDYSSLSLELRKREFQLGKLKEEISVSETKLKEQNVKLNQREAELQQANEKLLFSESQNVVLGKLAQGLGADASGSKNISAFHQEKANQLIESNFYKQQIDEYYNQQIFNNLGTLSADEQQFLDRASNLSDVKLLDLRFTYFQGKVTSTLNHLCLSGDSAQLNNSQYLTKVLNEVLQETKEKAIDLPILNIGKQREKTIENTISDAKGPLLNEIMELNNFLLNKRLSTKNKGLKLETSFERGLKVAEQNLKTLAKTKPVEIEEITNALSTAQKESVDSELFEPMHFSESLVQYLLEDRELNSIKIELSASIKKFKYVLDLAESREEFKHQTKAFKNRVLELNSKLPNNGLQQKVDQELKNAFNNAATLAFQPLLAKERNSVKDEEIYKALAKAKDDVLTNELVPLVITVPNGKIVEFLIEDNKNLDRYKAPKNVALRAENLKNNLEPQEQLIVNPVAAPDEPKNGISNNDEWFGALVNRRRQLEDIVKLMDLAAQHYIEKNENCVSFFHKHSRKGRDRATRQLAEFKTKFHDVLVNLDTEANIRLKQVKNRDLLETILGVFINNEINKFFVPKINNADKDQGNHYLHSWRTYQSLVLEEWQAMDNDPTRRLSIKNFNDFTGYQNLVKATEGYQNPKKPTEKVKFWYGEKKKITAEHIARTLHNTLFLSQERALDPKLKTQAKKYSDWADNKKTLQK